MKHQRLFALRLLPTLLLMIIATDVFSAEKNPTWGWKEEDGLGSAPRPRPSPTQNAWQPKVAAPAPDPVPSPKVDLAVKPAQAAEPSPTVKSYCENIADPALDARFLHQKAELAHLEEELAKKTALLEAKKVEFQEWMKRRDDFVSKAEGNLVKLYSKIKPDAAAPQLAAMDEEAAAALLLKLSAKSSSAILDQMDTAKAARLVSVMIGAARPSDQATTAERDVPKKAPAEQPSGGQQEAAKPQNNGKS
jgi:flagellar motility protein MotE (MotC chaperone)